MSSTNDYNSRKRFAFDIDMEIEAETTSKLKAGTYEGATPNSATLRSKIHDIIWGGMKVGSVVSRTTQAFLRELFGQGPVLNGIPTIQLKQRSGYLIAFKVIPLKARHGGDALNMGPTGGLCAVSMRTRSKLDTGTLESLYVTHGISCGFTEARRWCYHGEMLTVAGSCPHFEFSLKISIQAVEG
uniref:Uncharacterized protein n=1 Tax=Anopheles culicifacies TaxID=139723 RepID=A0A182MRR7_9DIPT